MAAAQPFAYDRVEYPDHWYPQSHPDRLAVIASLFGMRPALPQGCRVLELGCATGWNLLSMASCLPESQFVGVDLAARTIAQGREMAEHLGLKNVSLHALDLRDVDESFGTFDYIVAHGVYSWVPEPVRERLLALCKKLLAPQGVAYVSYSVYPGRYLTQMMREMMLFYCRSFEDPEEKAGQARAFLRFLREAQHEGSLYAKLLDFECDRVSAFPDTYFYHDDLSEVNAPCFFHQFAEHAGRHGLQYLAEANFHEMTDLHLSEETARICRGLAGNRIEWEQYFDFIVFRRFRQTLLCHQDVTLSPAKEPERMRTFYIAAPITVSTTDASGDGEATETFYSQGASTQTTSPLVKAALLHLQDRWPHYTHFDELVEAARAQVNGTQPGEEITREAAAEKLGETLPKLYAVRFVNLMVRRPAVLTAVSERPVASALARLQLQSRADRRGVSNLLSDHVRLEDTLDGLLLPLLDGTRDRTALQQELAALARQGSIELQQDGLAVTDPQSLQAIIAERLDAALERLAHHALLVA